MKTINIGLDETQRKGSIDLLNVALADGSILLIKTKKFHWDVVGPQFMTLHKLWDEQYATLALDVDAIAERVRALGGIPLGTAAGFLEFAKVVEHPGKVSSATAAVSMLLEDHELIVRNLRTAIDRCEDEFHDKGTADFLTGLMEKHEQMAWMLRSFLEGEGVKADGKAAPATRVPNYA